MHDYLGNKRNFTGLGQIAPSKLHQRRIPLAAIARSVVPWYQEAASPHLPAQHPHDAVSHGGEVRCQYLPIIVYLEHRNAGNR